MTKLIVLALVVSSFLPAVSGYKLPDSPGSIEFVNTDGRSYLDTGVEPGEMDCVFYRCRIYEGRALVRDYRPAVDPKTGIGLIYNKVSGKAVRMPGNPPLRLGRVKPNQGLVLLLY